MTGNTSAFAGYSEGGFYGKEEMEHGHFLGVIGTTLFILEGVNWVICLAHNHDFLVCAIYDRALN